MNIKKVTAFIFLASLQLFAADLVDVYRKKGAMAAIAEMEKELTAKSYWKSHLDSIDTTYGYFESDKDILVCDKSKPELKLYKLRDGKLAPDMQTNAIVGGGKGDKQKAGDKRTPIGAYELVNKLGNLNKFYGPFAFATNYPNLLDSAMGKNGHGIWIHGMPENGERNNSTQGCLVIDNDKLKQLETKINFKNTALIINESKPEIANKDDIAEIMSAMFTWRKTWLDNNLKAYLSYYDEDFKRFDGMRKPQFSDFKKRIFAKNERKEIVFKDFEVIPNPNAKNEKIYKVKFYEDYWAPSSKFKGEKELYVRLKNGNMTIILER